MQKIHQYNYWEGQTCRRTSFHPAVQAFAQPKVDIILKILKGYNDTMDSMSVLEVGSGSGHMSIFAKQHCNLLVASDYSMNMLSQNPVDIKLCCDASRLPFAGSRFDCVMCTNLLHHVEDPFATLREMRRVSKKYVIIIEPNRNNPMMYLLGLLTKSDRGLLKVSLNWLRSISVECGIAELHATSQGLVLPNVTPITFIKSLTRMEKWLKPHFFLILVGQKTGLRIANQFANMPDGF